MTVGAPANRETPRLDWNGHRWVSERPGRIAMVPLMRIERWDCRRDGLLTEAAVRGKVESRGYSVRARQCLPETCAPAEAHDRERVDAVVTGLLKVTIDGEAAILTAGDILLVPRGAVHRMEVVGSSPVRCLQGVYGDASAGDD